MIIGEGASQINIHTFQLKYDYCGGSLVKIRFILGESQFKYDYFSGVTTKKIENHWTKAHGLWYQLKVETGLYRSQVFHMLKHW